MAYDLSSRIIVVDDVEESRFVIEDTLCRLGFVNLESYEDPQVALLEIRRGKPPSMIITDFNMPGMNGLELLQQIEVHHPEIKAIIVTGDASNLIAQTKYPVIEKGPGFTTKIVECLKKIL